MRIILVTTVALVAGVPAASAVEVTDPVGDVTARRSNGEVLRPAPPTADIVGLDSRTGEHRVKVRVTFDELTSTNWDRLRVRLRLTGDESWSDWSMVLTTRRQDLPDGLAFVHRWPEIADWSTVRGCRGRVRRDGRSLVVSVRRVCLGGRAIEHVGASVEHFDRRRSAWAAGDDTEWSTAQEPPPVARTVAQCLAGSVRGRTRFDDGSTRDFRVWTSGSLFWMITVDGRTSADYCRVIDVIGPAPVP